MSELREKVKEENVDLARAIFSGVEIIVDKYTLPYPEMEKVVNKVGRPVLKPTGKLIHFRKFGRRGYMVSESLYKELQDKTN